VRFGEIEDLEEALRKDGETIAAFIIEPIQGAAGFVIETQIIHDPEHY